MSGCKYEDILKFSEYRTARSLPRTRQPHLQEYPWVMGLNVGKASKEQNNNHPPFYMVVTFLETLLTFKGAKIFLFRGKRRG